LVLIAIGGLAGNLPDIKRYGDWPAHEVSELYSTVSHLAAYGVVFLAVAFALFKSRRWGAYLVIVSVAALGFFAATWASLAHGPERADFAVEMSFWYIPLLLALIWALAETVRDLKDRKTTGNPGSRRNQIA
jgi:uncharacterized membrane protein (DUF2068 family)